MVAELLKLALLTLSALALASPESHVETYSPATFCPALLTEVRSPYFPIHEGSLYEQTLPVAISEGAKVFKLGEGSNGNVFRIVPAHNPAYEIKIYGLTGWPVENFSSVWTPKADLSRSPLKQFNNVFWRMSDSEIRTYTESLLLDGNVTAENDLQLFNQIRSLTKNRPDGFRVIDAQAVRPGILRLGDVRGDTLENVLRSKYLDYHTEEQLLRTYGKSLNQHYEALEENYSNVSYRTTTPLYYSFTYDTEHTAHTLEITPFQVIVDPLTLKLTLIDPN